MQSDHDINPDKRRWFPRNSLISPQVRARVEKGFAGRYVQHVPKTAVCGMVLEDAAAYVIASPAHALRAAVFGTVADGRQG
jgi:hypothetical protein